MYIIESRPETYDADKIWDEQSQVWYDPNDIESSSKKYQVNVVIVGQRYDGNGVVYFNNNEVTDEVIDYYSTNDDAQSTVELGYPNGAVGQTFTASQSYSLTRIGVKLLRIIRGDPTSLDIVTLSLYSVNGEGLPTGSALATATVDGDEISTEGTGEWVIFEFSTPYSIVEGIQYAIVITHPSEEFDLPELVWRDDETSPAYSGGEVVTFYYSDWYKISDLGFTVDFMFKCYGYI